jgi:hypothetical protein
VNIAQSRLAAIVDWIGRSSAGRVAPLGGQVSVGPYAVLVPCDFSAPPRTDFAASALPLFVATEQADAVKLPPIDTDAPDSQDHLRERLAHVLWRIQAGTLPPCAVVGLNDPLEPISDAVARAGAAGVDTTSYPVLATPLWAFSPDELEGLKLPLLQ